MQYVCVFLNQIRPNSLLNTIYGLLTIRLTPARSPYKCRISCVLICMVIDGSSAVQNEKIVFINNICSINQITVPIIVMQ